MISEDGPLALGDVLASSEEGVFQGDPKRLRIANNGDTTMREISVSVDGPSEVVQLARDEDGQPGVWASPGESIVATEDHMKPGDSCSFWARALFSMEDREGTYNFDFVLRGTSVG